MISPGQIFSGLQTVPGKRFPCSLEKKDMNDKEDTVYDNWQVLLTLHGWTVTTNILRYHLSQLQLQTSGEKNSRKEYQQNTKYTNFYYNYFNCFIISNCCKVFCNTCRIWGAYIYLEIATTAHFISSPPHSHPLEEKRKEKKDFDHCRLTGAFLIPYLVQSSGKLYNFGAFGSYII